MASRRRGQFFIISAVLLVSIFITMHQSLSSYGSLDLSGALAGKEASLLYGMREQANRTVFMAKDCGTALANLKELGNLAENGLVIRGNRVDFNYTVAGCSTGAEKTFTVNFNIPLQSDSAALGTSFTSVRT